MGQEARAQAVSDMSLNLTKEEMRIAKERFYQLDKDRKGELFNSSILHFLGHITVNDIRRHFRVRIF